MILEQFGITFTSIDTAFICSIGVKFTLDLSLTGSVSKWLALVTLVHVPQRTGGSMFEPCFGLGSYRWILGVFSSGVYPTVSHLLVH